MWHRFFFIWWGGKHAFVAINIHHAVSRIVSMRAEQPGRPLKAVRLWVSSAFLGSPCCSPLCSLCLCAACGQLDREREGKKKKVLAGSQSSRNGCRCCYLHYFHVQKNKEQEAANKSQEQAFALHSSSRNPGGWNRQRTTSWTEPLCSDGALH